LESPYLPAGSLDSYQRIRAFYAKDEFIAPCLIELTFTSLGLLAGLVVVRTFLSWTLVLEIEGRWPWRRELLSARAVRQADNAAS